MIHYFVIWIYTGEIDYTWNLKLEKLWIFGDRILAPEFCEIAMVKAFRPS